MKRLRPQPPALYNARRLVEEPIPEISQNAVDDENSFIDPNATAQNENEDPLASMNEGDSQTEFGPTESEYDIENSVDDSNSSTQNQMVNESTETNENEAEPEPTGEPVITHDESVESAHGTTAQETLNEITTVVKREHVEIFSLNRHETEQLNAILDDSDDTGELNYSEASTHFESSNEDENDDDVEVKMLGPEFPRPIVIDDGLVKQENDDITGNLSFKESVSLCFALFFISYLIISFV